MRSGLLAATLAFSISAGCKSDPPAPIPETPKAAAPTPSVQGNMPDWRRAIRHEVRYDAELGALVVDVTLEPGFHAYTVGETIGRPMLLEFDDNSGWLPDGEVAYPAGVAKDLPVGRSVTVEGTARIVAKVKPTGDGAGPAKGKLYYQVCTDEACDRPRSAPFSVAVTK